MATLYRKYRPQTFDEIIGQEHVVQTLKNAIKSNRLAHAYLFTGSRGTGKTTMARILAKAVNCTDERVHPCGKCANCRAIAEGRFVDLIEVDAASNRGIDEIRDLRDKIQFAPSIGKKRVYIIDEVHMLTKEAFNALLKTLEEPPEHTLFIFATTEIHKVPMTVISRCQRFDFRLAPVDQVRQSLTNIIKSENFKIKDEVIDLLIKASGGSFRDAQSLLGQLSPYLEKDELDLPQALKILNLSDLQKIEDFVAILESRDTVSAIDFIESLRETATDAGDFTGALTRSIRDKMITKVKAGEEVGFESSLLADLVEASAKIKISPDEFLPLELVVIGLTNQQTVTSQQAASKPEVNESATPETKAPADSKETADLDLKKPPIKKIENLEEISRDQRKAIVEGVSQKNKPLGVLLEQAGWGMKNDEILIEVDYSLHKDKIMSKKCLEILNAEIENVLGGSLVVSCAVRSKVDLGENIEEVFN